MSSGRAGRPVADEVQHLVDLKAGRRISVVLPALDEEDTVAGVVASVLPLVDGLVDEVVVVDSGSTDRTAARARAAGARVARLTDVLPGLEPRPGKGEVLWRSLAMTEGEIVVFLDTDLTDPDPGYVPRLVRPLLTDRRIHLVKGHYRRPYDAGDGADPDGGGRVTELCARPLLAALAPELADVLQPLGGEYAATRELLVSIPFAAEYGVEIGVLVDTWARHGRGAIAQVDLGERRHRHRSLRDLAGTSRQVVATLLDRLGVPDSGLAAGWDPDRAPEPLTTPGDRPPMIGITGRRAAV